MKAILLIFLGVTSAIKLHTQHQAAKMPKFNFNTLSFSQQPDHDGPTAGDGTMEEPMKEEPPSDEEMLKMAKEFMKEIDANEDGKIDWNEVEMFIRGHAPPDVPPGDVDEVLRYIKGEFADADMDGSGTVDAQEFVAKVKRDMAAGGEGPGGPPAGGSGGRGPPPAGGPGRRGPPPAPAGGRGPGAGGRGPPPRG